MEESNGVIEAAVAEEGCRHSIASKDGGAGALLESVKSGERGSRVEIAGAEKGLDAVVEGETGADESRGGIREAGITRGGRVGRRSESVERRLDAEAALAAASLGSSFLCRGEGEETDWH